MLVLADQLPPAPQTSLTEALRRSFDSIAPPGTRPIAVNEPNLAMVELGADVCVAGWGIAGGARCGGREFGESLAPEQADRQMLGSSILFTSRRYNRPMPYAPPRWARKVSKEHLRFRSAGPENWEYIKSSGAFPESSPYALDWIGMMPGQRGSRRLVGDVILTQQDLLRGSNRLWRARTNPSGRCPTGR